MGLLGPNGSGKTTTIQMLLGTLSPTSGSIEYFGKDFFTARTSTLQHVSFASTYASLPFVLTVEENLSCFGRLYGIKNAMERAGPLLQRFGIYEKRKEKVASLSAGQVTRLMLVKAFFTSPKIVLLDEPTASLDPDVSRDECTFLLDERKRGGISILFTSHKMQEVAELCDRVIVLKEGKIIADDLPKNLAKSIQLHKLCLTIVDGMKRTQNLAAERGISYEVDNRFITWMLMLNCLLSPAPRPASNRLRASTDCCPSTDNEFLQPAAFATGCSIAALPRGSVDGSCRALYPACARVCTGQCCEASSYVGRLKSGRVFGHDLHLLGRQRLAVDSEPGNLSAKVRG